MGHDKDDPSREIRDVVDVTDEDFYDIIGQDQYVFLDVYASWCGHCRSFVNQFQGLAGVVAADRKLRDRLVVAKMNGEKSRRASKRLGVTGYPTLLLFEPHKTTPVVEYEGERDAESIWHFLAAHVQ